ncbi:choloylglycine hydrolase family protein [Listeria fleischmannii]|uniref:choloylglycine hydrolase family protein n=1 Tax=Listeria fleischmannii TaxID=1069827 RepID=UPI00162927D4|nr:choloylglycine hydrolase family protein [Listeria fleischmannii]MBC1419594.1 choloylglycine hydrolase family protein [Listeria fleischmannii]
MIGCSSFTLETEDKNHFLSRTMDFSLYTDSGVVIIPRNYDMEIRNDKVQKTKLAFLGMAAYELKTPIFYDGLNESGVAGATLYYPGFATYTNNPSKEAINPLHVVSYVLANANSVDEVIELINGMDILNEANPILNVVPPLHYIFSDKTGRKIIVEPDPDGIKIYEANVGVLTNSPSYAWHEQNLRNYISVNPRQNTPIQTAEKTFSAFGQGSGTFGLPGDYTPPARFVRTAYMKFYAEQPKDELDGVTQIFHMLAPVEVPRGAVVHQNGHFDYSMYMASMCTTSMNYYFAEYNNRRIKKISLEHADKEKTTITVYPLTMKQDIDVLN